MRPIAEQRDGEMPGPDDITSNPSLHEASASSRLCSCRNNTFSPRLSLFLSFSSLSQFEMDLLSVLILHRS